MKIWQSWIHVGLVGRLLFPSHQETSMCKFSAKSGQNFRSDLDGYNAVLKCVFEALFSVTKSVSFTKMNELFCNLKINKIKGSGIAKLLPMDDYIWYVRVHCHYINCSISFLLLTQLIGQIGCPFEWSNY